MTEKPVLSRREEYAEATREALLNAAREIFVEEGFTQASVEAIARRARVTRGAFYHHFDDKQALFEALVVALQADAAERLAQGAAGEGAPFARLRAGAKTFLAVCLEPAYRRLVIQDAPAVLGSRRCREIGQTYAFGRLGQALSALKSAGLIDIENETLAGRMVGAMICEAALLLEDVENASKLEHQALEIIDRAFEALATKR
jgi:AcrR family transcriptional regulator